LLKKLQMRMNAFRGDIPLLLSILFILLVFAEVPTCVLAGNSQQSKYQKMENPASKNNARRFSSGSNGAAVGQRAPSPPASPQLSQPAL
ncbi:hypothetical protein MTO96_040376, partial [Rhipicephalus appendiculatus]